MQSSPPTPTRRRKSSASGINLSSASSSPQNRAYSSKRPSNSRKSSRCSITSSSTTRPISSYDRSGYFDASDGLDDLVDSKNTNGLGNLADELAEALDEEDDKGDELGDAVLESLCDRAEAICRHQSKENEPPRFSNDDQKGHAISMSPVQHATSCLSLSPPKRSLRARHTRKNPQYDGSDYGDDDDLEDTHGISLSLEARLAAVENLARRGTEANGSNADDVVQHLADSLKDLGSQAGVENAATR